MTADIADVPKLSLLEQLRMQLMQFTAQRDANQSNLHQLNGAIYACELMIKKHEDEENVKVDSEVKEAAAQ